MLYTRKGTYSSTYPISNFVSYDHLSPSTTFFIAALNSIPTPNSIKEALSHPRWHQTIIEELNAVELTTTWELVE